MRLCITIVLSRLVPAVTARQVTPLGWAWLRERGTPARSRAGARPAGLPHHVRGGPLPLNGLCFHGRARGRQAGTLRRYVSYCAPNWRARAGSSYQWANAAVVTHTAAA